MAKFIGTFAEFKKYFDGYCKNTAHRIASRERNSLNGICQYCGCKSELESAHVKGEERVEIIKRILNEHFSTSDDQVFDVDLGKFEKLYIDAHQPIEDHFFFLCRKHHREYDSEKLPHNTLLEGFIEQLNKKLSQHLKKQSPQ